MSTLNGKSLMLLSSCSQSHAFDLNPILSTLISTSPSTSPLKICRSPALNGTISLSITATLQVKHFHTGSRMVSPCEGAH
ncbi:hypothetical protein K469DRAFT_715407 [Zopfia rhizophila CBS 207.26]|uniref:Uncharacterized protein n=1 Tax=Zopfia rhizophila CBS 207.26 TaxID=1314779 RepID=A0A6A6DM40_9PEZI|nr:hypothetical protein K469DRAFT_715407 [Zopfia rhizophila CBS 207.26]